tara:strand:+ start:1198 stop:1320 length:123 start_codon:yes stop_codon:yes gene_type:complete
MKTASSSTAVSLLFVASAHDVGQPWFWVAQSAIIALLSAQ